MTTVTVIPTGDSRWPELKPVTLINNEARLHEIINTFRRNGIKYRVIYGEQEQQFKYPISPSFTSR